MFTVFLQLPCQSVLAPDGDSSTLGFTSNRRYGPIRGPTSSSFGGLWPLAECFFCPSGKKDLIMLSWQILGHFWCPVVTMVTFSSNLTNFKKNTKSPKNNF